MPQALSLGNGRLQVNLDDRLQVRDVHYPHVGEENHSQYGCPHRIGVWIDGQFSWLNDAQWQISVGYESDTQVGHSSAENTTLGLRLEFTDFVHTTKDVLGRRIKIFNSRNHERQVRIFFAYDLYLYGSKLRDTAVWEPDWNAIVHYRNHRYFLIDGQWDDGSGMAEFSVGKSNYEGREGTWRDAEDGHLSGNQVEQGSVDTVAGFFATIPAGSLRTLDHSVIAGKKYTDVRDTREWVRQQSFSRLIAHTRDYWRHWLGQSPETLPGIGPRLMELWKRSLLVLRTQIDDGGAIIASTDSDIMKFNRDSYAYCWMRDGAFVALTMARLGYSHVVLKFLKFSRECLTPEGFVLNKYTASGAVGSCWHPKMLHGHRLHAIQVDESALLPVVLAELCRDGRQIEMAQEFFHDLVLPIGEFLCRFRDPETGLPRPSFDPWEEHAGVWTYTCATVIAGLRSAADIAEWSGHAHSARRFRTVADEIADATRKNLWSEENHRFLKGLKLTADGLVADATVDATLSQLWELGALDQHNERVVMTMQAIENHLPLETGGIARYTGDGYHRQPYFPENAPGNAWLISTLWLANWQIERATTRGQLRRPRKLIDWCCEQASSAGLLPEQVDAVSGAPLSVAPLTWSHSTFLDTVRQYSKKYTQLEK